MDRRVRTGCGTCRKRRVKCDEARPMCNRCRTANFVCEGYAPPRQAPNAPLLAPASPRQDTPEGSSISELSWRHTNWRQEQLPLYHHFVTTTVVRLFRQDHINFWRDQVAQMSYGLDIVYEALLAIGAMHRSSLLTCQHESFQEATKFRVLGLRAYGNALRLLPSHLRQHTVADILAALIVLMLLTYFECFMENPKGAFRHLWAGIQLLQQSEQRLSEEEVSNMVPVYDAMLRLDFIAQKLIPYACSSFLRISDRAILESPFWNRPSPEFSGLVQSDAIAAERYSLIQLICAHNKLSRVVWGCWCPISERPSRDELMGFYSEMQLWMANSPATLASCESLADTQTLDLAGLNALPMPPPASHFSSNEAALNVAMYNAYMGCAVAMICTTDDDPAARELEAFKLVYQNLCITAELIGKHQQRLYKPCDAISIGIAMYLYHGSRRCFSPSWQEWTVTALRSIGREGLFNGFTAANTLEIMGQLENNVSNTYQRDEEGGSPIGHIRDRLIPMLMPHGEEDHILAFFLRYGSTEAQGDERTVQVVAKATWKEDATGAIDSLNLDVCDTVFSERANVQELPDALELFHSWRQEVEKGWHGYLAREVQEGFLLREASPNA